MLNQRRLVLVLVLIGASLVGKDVSSQARPDESRFTPVVLIDGGILDEPMVFEVTRDGRVYIAERKGRLMMYDPVSKTTVRVDSLAVNTKYVSAAMVIREAEEGFVGFTLDPNFDQNNFAYFLYAHPTTAKHVLSRMELRGTTLLKDTEKVLLEYAVQREACCHTGGGMTWDRNGNLYVTVGNNTGNNRGSQTDERPGRTPWDDQRGAANTNDLRGKILRIHPEPDGTYTIPAGNLFPPGTPGTRPEIYTMGHRNVWRPSIDSQTGFLYWGEVGPDASTDSEVGPTGYEEFNQARGPGFFGWPYFIGENRGYPIQDFVRGVIGPPKDPARPINNSVNNTGLRELPPAQPAFIAWPDWVSEKVPSFGSGGGCAVGGPVYRRADFAANAPRPWPAYFEGKWIATDCSRNWIQAISMAPNGDFVSAERWFADYVPSRVLDMKFGPDGDLYINEYGNVGFAKSPNSRLVRIEYNAGNRPPAVEITSNARGGAVPFNLSLSSTGSRDPDGDALRYEWRVAPVGGGAARTFTTADATVPFQQAGAYDVTLTVRDAAGLSASKSMRVIAGNEPAAVAIDVTGNRSFYFPETPLQYSVRVTDREGAVVPGRVAFSIDYVRQGFNTASLSSVDRPVDPTTRFAVAQAVMAGSDCSACHQPAVRSVGPSFREIATRYASDASATARLIQKVRAGGAGVWGDVAMPAHPNLTVGETAALVEYMLAANSTAFSSRPLTGTYSPEIPEGDNGAGSIVLRAVYTDAPVGSVPANTSEGMLVLRSPAVLPATAAVQQNVRRAGNNINPRQNGHIGFTGIDLTGISDIDITASTGAATTGGTIEVRLDSPTGQLLGQVEIPKAAPQGPAAPITNVGAQAAATGAAPAAGGGGGGGNNAAVPPRKVPLTGVTGVHDVYFVFKNDSVRPVDELMSFTGIRFNR